MTTWYVRGSALLLGIVLAGCAAQPLTSERQPAPPVRQEARLHLPLEPVTLDSARAVDSASLDLLGILMEGLLRQGANGVMLPGVAKRWESVDYREYTFYLREDARWSDGRQVTADDFVYAWLRVLDPRRSSDYAFLLYDIEGAEAWNTLDPNDPNFPQRSAELMHQIGMEAVNPTTLKVKLRRPNPRWPGYTAHPVFFPQRPSVVAERGKGYGALDQFVGNGPFFVEEVSPGKEIVLRRSLAYWDTESVRLERVSFRIEPDGKAALRLFDMGELDHVVLPGELAAAEPGSKRMTQPSTMGLIFHMGQARFANLKLRQAFHLALDRKRLVDEVARWTAIPSGGLIPPSLVGGWETAEPIDPEGDRLKARHLWESARAELRVSTMTVRLLHAPEAAGVARSIQAMLQESLVGLTVELEAVEFEQRLERVRLGQYDLVLQGWTADHDDPLSLLHLFVTDSPGNDPRWINQEYDETIANAQRSAEYPSVWEAEAEQILLTELPVLPLYHPVRHWLTKPHLKGLRHAPIGGRLDLRGAFLEH